MKLANGKTLTDDEADQRLVRQFRKIEKLHLDGACDHPRGIPPQEWPGIIRGARDNVAQDAPDQREIDRSPVPLGSDSAIAEGVSMREAFGPNWTVNGPMRR
jgi:hypothetical protein